MLSTPMTFSPRWSRRFATCIPRKPAAPVTRMVIAKITAAPTGWTRPPLDNGHLCRQGAANTRLEDFMSLAAVALDDKYVQDKGRVYLTGTQALVRLPLMQRRRDL